MTKTVSPSRVARYMLYALAPILAILAGFIALQHFPVIVRAVLGIAVVYLVLDRYVLSPPPRQDDSHVAHGFPYLLRYFVFMFTWCLIGYLALMQVVQMIFYYLKR